MNEKILFKGLVILLIVISIIGTVMTWSFTNSGIMVPTSLEERADNNEIGASGAGGNQVRFTIIPQKNKSSNESSLTK